MVIIGLPFALIQYRYARQNEQENRRKEQEERKKDREQRQSQTYQGVNDRYWQFQLLCMEHPELDVFDWADAWTNTKDAAGKRELIAFNMLLSLFERVFLLYAPLEVEFRKQQWDGWDQIIKLYCERSNFQQAWRKLGFGWGRELLGIHQYEDAPRMEN